MCILVYVINFMTPTTCEIKLTTARRKLLAEKYCSKKADQKVVIYKMCFAA